MAQHMKQIGFCLQSSLGSLHAPFTRFLSDILKVFGVLNTNRPGICSIKCIPAGMFIT